MYAIIETGGKQLKVEEGQVIYVEKLDVEAGAEYTFDKVVAIENNGLTLGTPYVEGAKVTCGVRAPGLHPCIPKRRHTCSWRHPSWPHLLQSGFQCGSDLRRTRSC